MRKVMLGMILVLLVAAPLLAHPASKIDFKFTAGQLDLIITHQVKDPTDHYIVDIKVSINGKQFITQTDWAQADVRAQKASYFIPGLKTGDVIKVDTRCVKFGNYSASYTVQ